MSNTVYLVCGVPGSGKSWVCEQLKRDFNYVPNDNFINAPYLRIAAAMRFSLNSPLDILTDCPFGERELRALFVSAGFIVNPYFIIEPAHVVSARYRKRTGQPLPKSAVTRCASIINRADEWGAPRGTSEQVLQMLKEEGAK